MLMKKAPSRANWTMVDDSNPQFCRFWDAYPRRDSKKAARKAWAKLNPSPQLVTQMIEALAWQVPLNRWDTVNREFAPYPASWLNGERWEDERPRKVQRAMSDAAALVFQTLNGDTGNE